MINIKELESLAISPAIPILGEVAHCKQIGDHVYVTLGLYDNAIGENIEHLISARYPGIKVTVDYVIEPKTVQPNIAIKKNVNNIIAVASGKGGVGKSSTAINLALTMSANGAKVGILDADIYGPSQPTMLGVHDRPELLDEKTMKPNFSQGIESNSIGYLVDGDKAMIWRAPMIVGALQQLINDTAWGSHVGGKLDYLFIDLPPGTGDIALSMAQKIPVTGAVTVTTPQDIALIDAKRSIKMFEKMHIDHLGIIENMSHYICEKCGHEEHIFGKDGGKHIADEFNVPYLGNIPLDIKLRQSLDVGESIVLSEPNHPISQHYQAIAQQIAIAIAKKPKSFSQAFGKIAIEQRH